MLSSTVLRAYARPWSSVASKAVIVVAGLLTFACGEPKTAPVSEDVSDSQLIERFLSAPNGDAEPLASVKDILATQRGQRLLQQITARRSAGSGRSGEIASASGLVASLVGDPLYTVESIPFGPDAAPTGTHPYLNSDDATTGLMAIGFNFGFFGQTYSAINISTNGFVGFDAWMSQGCCSGQLLPQPDYLNNIIAGLWTDLYPYGNAVTFGVAGTAPNRRYIIDWRDVRYYASNSRVSFQIKLLEGTNVIEIHSASVTSDGHARTQGIENAGGTLAYFIPGRLASTFTLSNDAVRFTPGVVDHTPPNIGVVLAGTLGGDGWYTSDVSIDWTVTDNESAVLSTTGCDDMSITADQAATTYVCSATSKGGTAQRSATVQRDATAPVIAYSGNAGTYTVDQVVTISCLAADAMSLLASNTCADITGDAYSFGVGSHSYSAEATDRAGNSSSASTGFAIAVTPETLCTLVGRWVTNDGVANNGVANSLCQKLDAAASREGPPRANILKAFANEVRAQSGKHIPADKAAILLTLAGAL